MSASAFRTSPMNTRGYRRSRSAEPEIAACLAPYDFAFMAQQGNVNRVEPESSEELMRFLVQTQILPLDGASPIELTRALFPASSAYSRRSGVDCSGALRARQDCPSALRGLDPPVRAPRRSATIGATRSMNTSDSMPSRSSVVPRHSSYSRSLPVAPSLDSSSTVEI